MLWVLVDIAIGVFALLVLGLLSFTLYTRVRATMRSFRDASDRVAAASTGLGDKPSAG